MKINKGLKIGLIVGGSALLLGGAVMSFIGGMPNYKSTYLTKDASGSINGVMTKEIGIGLLNFDNKSEGSFFLISKDDTPEIIKTKQYNYALEKTSKATAEMKKAELDAAKNAIDEAKKNPIPSPYKEWGIEIAESSLTQIEAIYNMPTMHGIAVTGLVFLPVGLVILVGSLLLKTKTKTE